MHIERLYSFDPSEFKSRTQLYYLIKSFVKILKLIQSIEYRSLFSNAVHIKPFCYHNASTGRRRKCSSWMGLKSQWECNVYLFCALGHCLTFARDHLIHIHQEPLRTLSAQEAKEGCARSCSDSDYSYSHFSACSCCWRCLSAALQIDAPPGRSTSGYCGHSSCSASTACSSRAPPGLPAWRPWDTTLLREGNTWHEGRNQRNSKRTRESLGNLRNEKVRCRAERGQYCDVSSSWLAKLVAREEGCCTRSRISPESKQSYCVHNKIKMYASCLGCEN